MSSIDPNTLISRAKNLWCPGCGNFAVQHALKELLAEMHEQGHPLENVVIVTGIGQHGKIFDFMNLNGFYSLHGRTIPVATGIKLANPDLSVICIAGDGDCYAEGLEHLIFGAKRNVDITVLVHDNRVYALTTGQYTPTSPYGFHGRSTPLGEHENPINPLSMMLDAGATFIGRAYTRKHESLKRVIREAILHKGFSFVDILQICATYNDLTGYYNTRVYDWDETDSREYEAAYHKAREWDYNRDTKIGLGVMYQRNAPVFGDSYPVPAPLPDKDRRAWSSRFLETRG